MTAIPLQWFDEQTLRTSHIPLLARLLNFWRECAQNARELFACIAFSGSITIPHKQSGAAEHRTNAHFFILNFYFMLLDVAACSCKLSSGILRRPRNWVAYSLSRPIASGGKKVPLKWGMTACQCQPPRLLPTSIIYPKAFKHVQSIFAMDVKVRKQICALVQLVLSDCNVKGKLIWSRCKTALSFRKVCSTVHEGTSPCVTGWHSQWSRFAWSRELRGEVKVHAFSAFRHVQTPKATGRQHCHTGFWTLGPLSKFRWIMVDVMVDDGGRDLPITAGHQQLSYYLYLTLVHDGSDFPLWATYVSACVRKTVIVFSDMFKIQSVHSMQTAN